MNNCSQLRLKQSLYKRAKKIAKRVSVVLYLRYQVSHKGSPKNGGRGQKLLIELEAKSNGSQDLRHRWVGVWTNKGAIRCCPDNLKVLSVLFNVEAKRSKTECDASLGKFSKEIIPRKSRKVLRVFID